MPSTISKILKDEITNSKLPKELRDFLLEILAKELAGELKRDYKDTYKAGITRAIE